MARPVRCINRRAAGTGPTPMILGATPAVLHYLGINPATIDPATNILTIQAGQDDLTTITTLTRDIGVSPRRLSQLFREQIGVSPKLYCRIQRFQ